MNNYPVWRGPAGVIDPEDRARVDAAIEASTNLNAVIGDVDSAKVTAEEAAQAAEDAAGLAGDAASSAAQQAADAAQRAGEAAQRVAEAAAEKAAAQTAKAAAEAARDDAVSAAQSLIPEALQDLVAAMLQGGAHTNISVTYDDAAGTINLTATGGGGLPTSQEEIEDFVGRLVKPAAGISVTYDDAGNTMTVALSGQSFTTTEKNKLAGIAAGATANASDDALRDRATHTGTQPISSVDGLLDALNDKASKGQLDTKTSAAGFVAVTSYAAYAAALMATPPPVAVSWAGGGLLWFRGQEFAVASSVPGEMTLVTVPAGYKRVQEYGIDRSLSYNWDNIALNIYLPAWSNGLRPDGEPDKFLSTGDPAKIAYNADKSVTLTAGFDVNGDWKMGTFQFNRPTQALGRWGAIVSTAGTHGVNAIFVHNDNGKELDFELTKGADGVIAWSPAVHMPKAGGGTAHSSKRVMTRGLFRPGALQRLEVELFANRAEFSIDGIMFETITPADMSDGAIWDVTTKVMLIASVERHNAWAGWTAADYALGASMMVHALMPMGPNVDAWSVSTSDGAIIINSSPMPAAPTATAGDTSILIGV